MVKKRDIVNIIKEKNNDITEELLNILILTIKSFDVIKKRHMNMFLNNNLNFMYIVNNDVKKIIYIDLIIKNKSKKIFIYETFSNKKIISKINSINDFNDYSLISIYTNYNNDEIRNIYSIEEFKIMIRDIKSMISFKIFLNTKNIKISDIYSNHNLLPLEIFYKSYFLENKKEEIINDNYKITIEFSSKYNINNTDVILYDFWKLLKNKIKKILINT